MATGVSDPEFDTRSFHRLHDLVRILQGQGQGQGFFDKYGLAQLQGLKDGFGMIVLGCRDDDGVHFGV